MIALAQNEQVSDLPFRYPIPTGVVKKVSTFLGEIALSQSAHSFERYVWQHPVFKVDASEYEHILGIRL